MVNLAGNFLLVAGFGWSNNIIAASITADAAMAHIAPAMPFFKKDFCYLLHLSSQMKSAHQQISATYLFILCFYGLQILATIMFYDWTSVSKTILTIGQCTGLSLE